MWNLSNTSSAIYQICERQICEMKYQTYERQIYEIKYQIYEVSNMWNTIGMKSNMQNVSNMICDDTWLGTRCVMCDCECKEGCHMLVCYTPKS